MSLCRLFYVSHCRPFKQFEQFPWVTFQNNTNCATRISHNLYKLKELLFLYDYFEMESYTLFDYISLSKRGFSHSSWHVLILR